MLQNFALQVIFARLDQVVRFKNLVPVERTPLTQGRTRLLAVCNVWEDFIALGVLLIHVNVLEAPTAIQELSIRFLAHWERLVILQG